jgi:hypothetical protein
VTRSGAKATEREREREREYTSVLWVARLRHSLDVASGSDGPADGWVSGVGLLPWMRWAETYVESFTSPRGTSSTCAQGAMAPTGGAALRCSVRKEKIGGTIETADELAIGGMRRRLGGVWPSRMGRHEAGHEGGGVAT